MVREMELPAHKTKIIATIGPVSRHKGTIEKMIKAGMSVARINFPMEPLRNTQRPLNW